MSCSLRHAFPGASRSVTGLGNCSVEGVVCSLRFKVMLNAERQIEVKSSVELF